MSVVSVDACCESQTTGIPKDDIIYPVNLIWYRQILLIKTCDNWL